MPLIQMIEKYKKELEDEKVIIGQLTPTGKVRNRANIKCLEKFISDLEKELSSNTLSDGEEAGNIFDKVSKSNLFENDLIYNIGNKPDAYFIAKRIFIEGYKSKPSINLPTMDRIDRDFLKWIDKVVDFSKNDLHGASETSEVEAKILEQVKEKYLSLMKRHH